MAGINRALYNYSINEIASQNSVRKCVFLSHKHEDKAKAVEIGEFLTTKLDLDIYLDINDRGLQEAVKNDNHKKITELINLGVDRSTHLLCLISDRTQASWWVPYEIGYGKKSGREIATLKLKGINDIPSYLKIEKYIPNYDELVRYYAPESNKLATLILNESKMSFSNRPLYNILD